MGCHFLLQGIFVTQQSNWSLLQLPHWQAVFTTGTAAEAEPLLFVSVVGVYPRPLNKGCCSHCRSQVAASVLAQDFHLNIHSSLRVFFQQNTFLVWRFFEAKMFIFSCSLLFYVHPPGTVLLSLQNGFCVLSNLRLCYQPSPLTQAALRRSFVEFSDLHSISCLTLSLSSVCVHFPHIYTARLSAESSRFFFSPLTLILKWALRKDCLSFVKIDPLHVNAWLVLSFKNSFVVLGLGRCVRAFSSCGAWAAHCGVLLRSTGSSAQPLPAPRHMQSSQTRGRTRVPCIGRRISVHCTTKRESVSRLVVSDSLWPQGL